MGIRTLQFNSAIRAFRQMDHEKIKGLLEAVEAKLAKCGLSHNKRKAVGGLPAGSDNFNGQSFLLWLDSVPEPPEPRLDWQPDAETATAYDQLVAIHATIKARM